MFLEIISRYLGSITTIAVFLGGVWMLFKKTSTLVNKVDTILDGYSDLQKTVEEHDKYIENHECFSASLKEKLDDVNSVSEKDMELTLCMSREKLLRILTNVIIRKGWLDSTELMVTQRLIDAYTGAGGNSEICIMWKKAKVLPILAEE